MLAVMRTTLDIDGDILKSVKELAAKRRTTMGRVLSELARIALAARNDFQPIRNGVPILRKKPDAGLVTLDIVNRLRDES